MIEGHARVSVGKLLANSGRSRASAAQAAALDGVKPRPNPHGPTGLLGERQSTENASASPSRLRRVYGAARGAEPTIALGEIRAAAISHRCPQQHFPRGIGRNSDLPLLAPSITRSLRQKLAFGSLFADPAPDLPRRGNGTQAWHWQVSQKVSSRVMWR